jgi:ketopantoate reductase
MKITIVGIGGVGGYYGGLLAKRYFDDEDVEIIFIARGDHLEQITRIAQLTVEYVPDTFSLNLYGNA